MRLPSPVGTGRRAGALIAFLALMILARPGPVQATIQAAGEEGAIEGTLHLNVRPARKTAPRYAGASPATHTMQPVSAVVYLTGPASGAASAFGSSASPESDQRVESVPEADPAAQSGRSPGSIEMAQIGSAFVPSSIAVRSGTVVRFPNADPYFHNVYSYTGGARFDLGRYPAGATRDVTFDQPGIVMVACEVHQFMRALILVTDHGFHDVVAEDGTFRITNIPAGEYTLTAYHPDYGAFEQSVTVAARETVRVRLDAGG